MQYQVRAINIDYDVLKTLRSHQHWMFFNSNVGSQLAKLMRLIDSSHSNSALKHHREDLLVILTSNLFDLLYESGWNPCGDESDDVSPWDLWDSNLWMKIADLELLKDNREFRFEIVAKLRDRKPAALAILGRNYSNTHYLCVML